MDINKSIDQRRFEVSILNNHLGSGLESDGENDDQRAGAESRNTNTQLLLDYQLQPNNTTTTETLKSPLLPKAGRDYVRRALSPQYAIEGISHADTRDKLRQIITYFVEHGLEDDVPWDTYSLPQQLLFQERDQFAQDHTTGSSTNISSSGVDSHGSTQELLIVGAGTVLARMIRLRQELQELKRHIECEIGSTSPMHKWNKFRGYSAFKRAISNLEGASEQIRNRKRYVSFTEVYLQDATACSTEISKIAVFAMSTMGREFEAFTYENLEDNVNIQDTDIVLRAITDELTKLVKHCTEATTCTYSTLDLLREHSRYDTARPETAPTRELKCGLKCNSERGSGWAKGALILAVMASITALAAVLSVNPVAARTIKFVTRTDTEQTNNCSCTELYGMKEQIHSLEHAVNANGQRVDNLVDSLGPTNELGLYYPSTVEHRSDRNAASEMQRHMYDVSENMDRKIARLQDDMKELRKSTHRMDLRLTTQLKRVNKGT